MEGSGEPNHLKGESFSPIIELIPKGNGHIDLPERYGLFPRHDAVERCSGWAEACPVDAHLVERLCVHDVEATASVHQYFGESLQADISLGAGWSVRSKVMADSDHRRKGGVAGWAV